MTVRRPVPLGPLVPTTSTDLARLGCAPVPSHRVAWAFPTAVDGDAEFPEGGGTRE